MTNVIPLHPGILGDGAKIAPDDVLQHAVGRLETVCLVGIDSDGQLYVAASDGAMESVFLMERAKLMLIEYEVGRS